MMNKIRSEYLSYSRAEKFFIFFIMLCSFAITGEASIAKAATNSIFLSVYTAHFFPVAWLASLPLNFILVSFYTRFLGVLGCTRMLILTISVAIGINLVASFYFKEIPYLPFFMYLWKDIVIILMFQQLWSVINASINFSKAKYLYGIFFGMGGLGSVLGCIIPGFFAVRIGSEKLLLTTIPFFILIGIFYTLALRQREKIATRQDISSISKDPSDIFSGLKLIFNSKFLKFVLLITCCMQVSSTMLDFQFSSYLEKTFVEQDLRTEFLGKLFSIVSTCNVFLQFFGSFFLVRYVGLKMAHFLIPFILGLNAFTFLIFPSFRVLSITFGCIKSMDYSLFGIIKEMLYIPLKASEKFKATAFIDVFAYRSSKAVASLIILALQTFSYINISHLISYGVLLIWMLSVLFMFKYYEKEVGEMHTHWPLAASST